MVYTQYELKIGKQYNSSGHFNSTLFLTECVLQCREIITHVGGVTALDIIVVLVFCRHRASLKGVTVNSLYNGA